MPKSSLNIPLKRAFYALIFVATLPTCLQTHASENSGLTLHPHAGVVTSSSIKDFGQDTSFGLGIGYQFNRKWAIEWVKQQANSTLKSAGKPDIDIDNWHIDALYHFTGNDSFKPYASAGYGVIDYDVEGADNDDGNVFNLGFGLRHPLSRLSSLRADIRSFHSTDFDYAGTVTTLGFHHQFAAKASPPAPIKTVNNADDDRDSIPNHNDECPETNLDTHIDQTGCPMDEDKDGIPDHADQCPRTNNRLAKIDSNGCYIMVTEEISISEVFYFATGSFTSRDVHTPKLDNLVNFLNKYPASDVLITGHTDSQGDANDNMLLSENRVKTISDALLKRFKLDASRVFLRSYGETRPAKDVETKRASAANRRVTVEIFTQQRSIALK